MISKEVGERIRWNLIDVTERNMWQYPMRLSEDEIEGRDVSRVYYRDDCRLREVNLNPKHGMDLKGILSLRFIPGFITCHNR